MPIAPRYIHRFVEPALPERAESVWMLLHGPEGDESELVPGALQLLDKRAALLCPRGKHLEEGKPRYYRQFSQTVLDVEELRFRARELAAFFRAACREYGLTPRSTGMIGLEGGATVGAAAMLLEPAAFHQAILLRPMLAFEPATLPCLKGRQVFIAAARHDPLIPPQEVEELALLLIRCGASVELSWQDGGHGVTQADLASAARWLAAASSAELGANEEQAGAPSR